MLPRAVIGAAEYAQLQAQVKELRLEYRDERQRSKTGQKVSLKPRLTPTCGHKLCAALQTYSIGPHRRPSRTPDLPSLHPPRPPATTQLEALLSKQHAEAASQREAELRAAAERATAAVRDQLEKSARARKLFDR